jgi:hypothetical protein
VVDVNQVFTKAAELAEALRNTPEFKEKNEKGLTLLIAECNMVIATETRINYGALGKKKSACCG